MADRHHVAAILDNSRDELAEAITDRHYELHPELAERFGRAGRSHCREDAQYHLSYLSAAVAAGTPAFFTEYVGWCKAMLGARRIPADDLAENLGIMREVLERSLAPDVRTVAVSQVDAGLVELGRVSTAPSSLLSENGGPLAQLAHDYLSALLRAERHLASSLILTAANAGTPGRLAVTGDHEVGCAPDLDFRYHAGRLSGEPLSTVICPTLTHPDSALSD
jgi:MerR family transcriptional regulator, light-induced transcriptional regulator